MSIYEPDVAEKTHLRTWGRNRGAEMEPNNAFSFLEYEAGNGCRGTTMENMDYYEGVELHLSL